MAVAVVWRWARGSRLVEDKAGVSPMRLIPLQPAPLEGTTFKLPEFCACRGKSARVINYEEFKKALEELAPKRFKGKSAEEAYEAICQLVAGKEPANVGVTVSDEPLSCWEQEGWLGGEDGALPAASQGTPWPRMGWGLHRFHGHGGHGRVLSGFRELG